MAYEKQTKDQGKSSIDKYGNVLSKLVNMLYIVAILIVLLVVAVVCNSFVSFYAATHKSVIFTPPEITEPIALNEDTINIDFIWTLSLEVANWLQTWDASSYEGRISYVVNKYMHPKLKKKLSEELLSKDTIDQIKKTDKEQLWIPLEPMVDEENSVCIIKGKVDVFLKGVKVQTYQRELKLYYVQLGNKIVYVDVIQKDL
ncbi:MAG: DUF2895 family protein [Brevinematales bacterium]|nr:DUF2895 family protein [Brevinematales bacterium]